MYTITYSDNTVFKGGDYKDSKWNDMPKKCIKTIKYKLNGKLIILKNYESYNHIVERTYYILGSGERIKRVILMGAKENKIIRFIFNIYNDSFYIDVVEFGKEFKGKSVTGWKEGLKDKKASYYTF